jgi:(E)-4-hydroxy-3-methylbut-2-enyl-diphosphate synthase
MCLDDTRRHMTRAVEVGTVRIGAGAPIAVQSMLSCRTDDVVACLSQIERLRSVGCEIVRIALPDASILDGFEEICARSALPVVADIHFDYRLAIEAAQRGASKLRINPGNIGSVEKVDAVIDAAGEAGIPIRIGVNAGSLEKDLRDRSGWTLPEKLVESARRCVTRFEARGFTSLVVSAKVHDVEDTVTTYRLLAHELPQIPLHIGVTEAGTVRQGTVKSSIALGRLLAEGIGDTMRVSLTGDVCEEVRAAWEILAALGLRRRSPELISCPTCGRCKIDLVALAEAVQARLEQIDRPLIVAVMGCVVNGPGEAASADVGVAGGQGEGVVFVHGQVVRKVPEDQILTALFEEIERLDA